MNKTKFRIFNKRWQSGDIWAEHVCPLTMRVSFFVVLLWANCFSQLNVVIGFSDNEPTCTLSIAIVTTKQPIDRISMSLIDSDVFCVSTQYMIISVIFSFTSMQKQVTQESIDTEIIFPNISQITVIMIAWLFSSSSSNISHSEVFNRNVIRHSGKLCPLNISALLLVMVVETNKQQQQQQTF